MPQTTKAKVVSVWHINQQNLANFIRLHFTSHDCEDVLWFTIEALAEQLAHMKTHDFMMTKKENQMFNRFMKYKVIVEGKRVQWS